MNARPPPHLRLPAGPPAGGPGLPARRPGRIQEELPLRHGGLPRRGPEELSLLRPQGPAQAVEGDRQAAREAGQEVQERRRVHGPGGGGHRLPARRPYVRHRVRRRAARTRAGVLPGPELPAGHRGARGGDVPAAGAGRRFSRHRDRGAEHRRPGRARAAGGARPGGLGPRRLLLHAAAGAAVRVPNPAARRARPEARPDRAGRQEEGQGHGLLPRAGRRLAAHLQPAARARAGRQVVLVRAARQRRRLHVPAAGRLEHPGGQPIEGRGIQPDEGVEVVPEEAQAGQNSAILRAEAFLLGG